jgi:CHAT domain-containing protein
MLNHITGGRLCWWGINFKLMIFLKIFFKYYSMILFMLWSTDTLGQNASLSELDVFWQNVNEMNWSEVANSGENIISSIEMENYADTSVSIYYIYTALAYGNLEQYSRCIELYEKARFLFQQSNYTLNEFYLFVSSQLADVYLKFGKFEMCANIYKESLELCKLLYGRESRDYALLINTLAVVYSYLGEYSKSKELNEESLKLAERFYGNEHENYAVSLFNLSMSYSDLGDYQKSKELNQRCLKIRQTNLGKDHPDCLKTMNHLASDYANMGNHLVSLAINEECLEICRKSYGDNNVNCFRCMRSLAADYYALGDFEMSMKLNVNSLNIIENAEFLDSNEYAETLIGVARDYSNIGNIHESNRLINQCLGIWQKLFGYESRYCALALNNLANNYSDLGLYERSKELNEECLKIKQAIYGKEHWDYILSLNNLAIDYANLGDYANCKSLLLRCRSFSEDRFGIDDDFYLLVTSNIILVSYLSHDYNACEFFFNELFRSIRLKLKLASSMSEDLRQLFKMRFNEHLWKYSNYLQLYDTVRKELATQGFEYNLLLKGWGGDYKCQVNRQIQLLNDSSLFGLYDNLRKQRVKLADYYNLPLDELSKRGIDLHSEEGIAKDFESELSSRVQYFESINSDYGFKDLQNTLVSDEAYVEILNVPHFDYPARIWSDSTFYLAYLVTRDTRNVPLLINIGDGKQIDEVLYPYLVGQTSTPTSTIMDGQVYNLLWKPLENHLVGITKVYLSLGGVYQSINPETIFHTETGKYLFEEKEIHLVNSGRSFVDQRIYGNRDYTDRTALIMGAPNFDYSYVADSTLLEDNVSFTYQTMRDLSLDGNRRAAPLPATRSEVEGINNTLARTDWSTQLLTGNDALEMNLKQMESPRILHIATHGYFLEDIKPENDNGMRMMGMDVQRVAENPMLRSGLLLAGCNKTLADNTLLTGADNGILTAYEAGLLDLSKTELVVLSACETGKGEILNGEGVQGLRKAMTDAGAEHILMSLWKVDDKVTSDYMQTFYGHYAQGKSIRESYNLTRNEIKQKYPQPYYWGAFVLVGE